MVLKRVGVVSIGKMYGALSALFGLIGGFFISVAALLGAAGGDGGIGGLIFGVGAIILLPIFYGVLGFIGGIIGGFFYNFLAGIVGGIEFEFEDKGY